MPANANAIAAAAAELIRNAAAKPSEEGIRSKILAMLGEQSLRTRKAREMRDALAAEIERQLEIRSERAARKPEKPKSLLAKWLETDRAKGYAAMLRQLAGRLYRLGTRSGVRIIWTLKRPETGTITETEECTPYRGHFKGWVANEYKHAIRVSPGTVRRAEELELLSPGGLLTVWLGQAERVDRGIIAIPARWIEQGRGCTLRVVGGWIAAAYSSSGGCIAARHGDDREQALRRLRTDLSPNIRRLMVRGISAPRIAEWAREFPSAVARMEDARSLGFCESGIRNWCRVAGLERQLEAGAASLSELAEGIRRYYHPDAARLAAVVYRRAREAAECAKAS